MGRVTTSHLISAERQAVFAYLTDLNHVPEQLDGIIETEFPVPPPKLAPMVEFKLSMTRYGVTARIIARVESFQEPERISYRQLGGFFKTWSHSMHLDEHGPGQTRLTEVINFTMPYGLLGSIADDLYVRADIARVMNERAEVIMAHFNKLAVRSES
jgi:hypothetical protein